MAKGSWAKRAILAAALVSAATIPGCSGFWKAPTDSGSGSSGGGTNPASGTFYVLNQTTNQIAGFSFASGSTTPTSIGNVTLPDLAFAMAISPNGNFLYVSTASGIYLYTVSSTGSLTLGNSSQPISSDPAYAMQVDPSGSWLLEAVSGAATLSAVPLNTSTGLYDTSASVATVALSSDSVQGIAVSPSGSAAPYVFVAMGTGGTAAVHFTSGNANPFGNAATIKVKNSLGGDNAVAVDPSNRLLYVGETTALSATQSGGLRVFTIGSSALNEITGSPFATGGTGPSSIVPTSTAVYVANSAVSGKTTGNITGFTVTASGTTSPTYKLSSINTIAAGQKTASITLDGTSTYLLAANFSGNPDLSTYTFDATTTGKLVAGPTATTGTDPVGALSVVAVP